MKKNKYIIVGLLLTLLTGCSNTSNSASLATDEVLSAPSVSVIDGGNEEATGSYDNMEIVNGFWVKEIKDKNGTVYAYVPMMSEKINGIYDFEDAWEIDMKICKRYTSYNCPKGASEADLKAKGAMLNYCTNPCLGRNADKKHETVEETQRVRQQESFCLVKDNSNNNTLCNYDVQCVTFALYKNVFENYPDIKFQIYGIDSDYIEKSVGDINTCSLESFSNFMKKCQNEGYVNCTLLGEREVTESSIYYIDYNKLGSKGAAINKNFIQYLLVLNVSDTKGFAYYMLGDGCYNITDEVQYAAWKKEHINQFIGE